MMQKDRVTIHLSVNGDPSEVIKWFQGMLLFEAKQMSLTNFTKNRERAYKKAVFFTETEKEVLLQKYNISLGDGTNLVYCGKSSSSNVVMLSAMVDYNIYRENKNSILNLIDTIMMNSGIVGQISDLEDSFWQNYTDLAMYKMRGKSLEGVPQKLSPTFTNKMVVDTEKLPGYEKQIDNIWFGAAWKMWFNTPYYEFVSEDVLRNYKNCFENRKVSASCINITLYEDLSDYDKPENRTLQWAFKEAINFQGVVEKYRKTGINRVDDPEVMIETGNFEHGGVRLIRGFFDVNDNSVPKSKAAKEKILEYDEKGEIIWHNEIIYN